MLPLILLPGMMCDARLFAPQVAALSGRATLHLPAIRGETMELMARDVLSNAPPRFALAGLSMGGMIAMEVLRQARGRVERVAVLDTSPHAETEAAKALRGPQILRARHGDLEGVMREDMLPTYLAEGSRRQDVLDLCLEMALALGPDVFEEQSLALQSRVDQSDTLRGLDVPSLVLCGDRDRRCPVERHELMHALIPGSTLEIIPGAGHLPTLEQPEQTNAALVRWLES